MVCDCLIARWGFMGDRWSSNINHPKNPSGLCYRGVWTCIAGVLKKHQKSIVEGSGFLGQLVFARKLHTNSEGQPSTKQCNRKSLRKSCLKQIRIAPWHHLGGNPGDKRWQFMPETEVVKQCRIRNLCITTVSCGNPSTFTLKKYHITCIHLSTHHGQFHDSPSSILFLLQLSILRSSHHATIWAKKNTPLTDTREGDRKGWWSSNPFCKSGFWRVVGFPRVWKHI